MLNNSFKYYNVDSFIHFVNPLCKLLIFIIFAFMVLFSSSFKSVVALFIVVSFIVGLSNISYKRLFDCVWFFRYFVLFLLFFGFFVSFKFCLLVLVYSVFVMSTKIDSLIGGFYCLFRPFEIFGISVYRFSIMCGLFFNFSSFFIDEYNSFFKVQCSREKLVDVKFKFISFVNVFFSTYRKILKKRDIMLIRGVGCFKKLYSWHLTDVYVVMCHLIVLVLVLVKEVVV